MLASRTTPKTAALLCVAAATLLAACATQREGTTAAGAAPRPKVVTVPRLTTMVEQGTTVGVIFGEIQGSGTVYRLTTEQATNLRANGMPASLVSFMQSTYEHAIQANPALATSNDKWTEVDGYWYGGLPYGWPKEWVVGAPAPGMLFR